MRSSYYYYPTWSKRCKDIIDNSLKRGRDSFKDFIAKSGLLEEWVANTSFWLAQEGIFHITLDHLINDYANSLSQLSRYLSLPLPSVILRPGDPLFNKGAGVVSPGLTKNKFKREEFIDFINLQIKNYKNEHQS